jgi:hypothetical protein
VADDVDPHLVGRHPLVNPSSPGLSLAYQLSAIAGGYVPTAATALLLVLGGDLWLIGGGFALVCATTATCVFLANDVSGMTGTIAARRSRRQLREARAAQSARTPTA